MQKKLIIGLLLVYSSTCFSAEFEDKRERIHSVRKVVDSVGKLEEKETSMADSFKHMFVDGKVSGQVRTMYAGYNQKAVGVDDTYATAIGGILKYELAEFKGFNAGVAFYTAHDISFATGDGVKQNNELSSTSGSYTEVAEAYLNYTYEDVNVRVGRQILDTPLADSDDIRMIPNTFNAYVLNYNYTNFDFTLGHIVSWQGVDADLDLAWSDTAKNGTTFGGLTYNDGIEFGAWYYNVRDLTNAAYIEVGGNYTLNETIQLHTMLQYLNEKELANSGVEATIYGALFELVAYDIGFNIAYDKSLKKTAKQSFSGFGGGTLYTSMDTMILDEIAQDRDAEALVTGVSYTIGDFGLLYAYGDFDGGADSLNVKAHIVEQDIGATYTYKDDFEISAIYVISEDKESSVKTFNDWNRLQIMATYNF